MPARYTIGIDLGTSNCALAYVDAEAENPTTVVLDIPQYESLGQWRESGVLPSFCYFLTDDEARELSPKSEGESDVEHWSRSRVVGLWAREQASRSPERVAFSAKSWLCHRGIDRESKILPWQSSVLAAEQKLSPVDVSAAYLSYLRTVWDQRMAASDKQARFEKQDVVITAPASFDSDAQRLTLEAAERAGYPANTRLLEEPQAAFYAWLERHAGQDAVVGAFPNLNEKPELVLVCDIGGGTSDFSLFEVTEPDEGTQPAIRRIAVSEHILLGGDNLDLAIAKRFERELGEEGSLSTSAWAQLLSQSRTLKERVLSQENGDREAPLRVSVTEGGSSLFGSARSAELSTGELLDLLLEGFFPDCPADSAPQRERTGIRELGLPFAQDYAITRHLAGFLRGRRVDSLLFNGGTVASNQLRHRLQRQVGAWQEGVAPKVLINDEPHLAVARGASYYRLSERAAAGFTITGGAAHAIYLEVGGAGPSKKKGRGKRRKQKELPARTGVCILPQGAEVETPMRLVEPEVQMMVDRPVRLQAWTSPARPDDDLGAVVDLDGEDFHRLPALQTMAQLPLDADKPEDGKVAVHLIAELNNLGLVQITCESVRRFAGRQRRWALEFNLRQSSDPVGDVSNMANGNEDTGVSSEDLTEATAFVEQYFAKESYSSMQSSPPLLKAIEEITKLRRKEWNTALLRRLWEPLGAAITRRDQSLGHELTWLTAAGFFLRPGYGHPLDPFRMQRLWLLHELGLSHDRDKAVREQAFILCRRTAGGLDAEQQQTLYAHWRDRVYEDSKATYEALRMAGALERLPIAEREALAKHCVERIIERRNKFCDHATWALGRLLTRTPLYGGESAILPVARVAEAFDALSELDWQTASSGGLRQAFVQAARRLDHRDHDLDEPLRQRIETKLLESKVSEQQIEPIRRFVPLEDKDRQQLFGESLPVGLHW